MCVWCANSEGPESVSWEKKKTGNTQVTVQHSCSGLGGRDFSPNAGGVFTRGTKCFVCILILLRRETRLECLSEGGTEHDGRGK